MRVPDPTFVIVLVEAPETMLFAVIEKLFVLMVPDVKKIICGNEEKGAEALKIALPPVTASKERTLVRGTGGGVRTVTLDGNEVGFAMRVPFAIVVTPL